MYSPKYLDPTISKEELKKPLEDTDPRKYMKIKAAETDETTLADYDPIVKRFVAMIMKEGDKKVARKIIAKAFEEIKHTQVEKYHKADQFERTAIELDPVKVLHKAIDNAKPLLMTTKIRKGGIAYQVPIPCRPRAQLFKSMKWLIESSLKKEDTERFYNSLAKEILDASENKGKAIGKKLELHKLCETNKAYAHYRWA